MRFSFSAPGAAQHETAGTEKPHRRERHAQQAFYILQEFYCAQGRRAALP